MFAGSGTFRDASQPMPVKTDHTGDLEAAVYHDAGNRSVVLFERGDEVTVQAGDMGGRRFASCETSETERSFGEAGPQ